eukprot:TRINITY_DN129_c1_g1_i12.p3 TRINITY_DN129_c1_g1~~TRINITY_DN129_c1_g1_i12.p3  ORF type:complete len:183 (-),score=22.04 TRINITY_DN129_c1_g1_i12:451-999(-)
MSSRSSLLQRLTMPQLQIHSLLQSYQRRDHRILRRSRHHTYGIPVRLRRYINRFGAYDIAILKLSFEAPLQIETMAYAYQSCTTQTLKMFTVGYPSDKGYDADVMVESVCEVEVDTCSGVSVFPHTCDTFGGMSGSTIWAEENGRLVIRGIHTRADLLEERNYGVLLTREAGQFISNAEVSS